MFHSSRAPLANPHLRAYRGSRRLFARIRALCVLPQFTRATRKPALTCLPRLSPLVCSYSGAHSMHVYARTDMQACLLLIYNAWVNCYFILYTIFIDSETPCLFMVIHGNIGGDA